MTILNLFKKYLQCFSHDLLPETTVPLSAGMSVPYSTNNKKKNKKDMKEQTKELAYEKSIKIIKITAAIIGGIAILSGVISLLT